MGGSQAPQDPLEDGFEYGILTMSVPKSIHRIVIVPRGSGMSRMINSKNGEISGMLLVKV